MHPQEHVIRALPDLLSAATIEQVKQHCQQLVSNIGLISS